MASNVELTAVADAATVGEEVEVAVVDTEADSMAVDVAQAMKAEGVVAAEDPDQRKDPEKYCERHNRRGHGTEAYWTVKKETCEAASSNQQNEFAVKLPIHVPTKL